MLSTPPLAFASSISSLQAASRSFAAAEVVAAAVAHPAEVRATAAHQKAHEGSAQTAPATAVRFAGLADALVRPLRGDVEEVGGLVLLPVVSVGPGRVGILRDLEEPADGVDADTARHLARLVSAHPVADGGELEPRRKQEGVLVVVSLAPDVGRAGEFERHRERA